MMTPNTRIAGLVLAGLALAAAPSFAQRRDGGNRGDRGGGQSAERAQPRAEPRGEQRGEGRPNGVAPRGDSRPNVAAPRGVRPTVIVPRNYGYAYRPYVRPYGYSRPYYYTPYAVPYGWRPYGYRPGWNLNLYFGRPYAYGYGYGYGYQDAYGYYSIQPGRAYGAVRIVDAPREAQVFVDGYYAGIVDDYDGVFQHLNLEAGAHHIEIQSPGFPPSAFDVNVIPGETITYHAYPRR